MAKRSAGLLMFRYHGEIVEVLLVHPGGPFWKNKDEGAWSIPKGEYSKEEEPLKAAKREFEEETGFTAEGDFKPLKSVIQPSGKEVIVWAFQGDCDPLNFKSNMFSMEWPPHSGKQQEFPEVDSAQWFTIDIAKKKITKGQIPILEEVEQLILPPRH